ncbi:PH domain-containing protein [Microbacterium sp. XT11]|uniref:PH domain-containing protein n=1 Tax=Microbacterium sp. XT11 TaxID=367477 RepID=UPI000829DB8F|nr:PH domain-containing protein [Microbacterium sp. XT11]
MSAASGPEPARTYRAGSGGVSFWLSVLLAVFLLGDAFLKAGWSRTVLLAPWVLLGVWIVYEIAYVSSVRVDADGAVVRNMLRRTTFPWDRVRDIDLRWQLVFSLDDGRDLSCWGGPATARPPRATADGESVRVPASVRALTEVRDLWQADRGSASGDPIRRTWDVPALVALGVIVVWAVAAVVIAYA